MGRSLSMSLLVAGACCCALVFVVDGLPAERRFKRQTTTDNASSPSPDTGIKLKVVPDESTSDSSLSTQSTPTSSSSPSTSSQRPSTNNNFGLGAVAGIGGLTRGVGIGNFHLPDATKNDPLAPWGAFAGLNLGDGARIGAGCQGLSCGVQLGHFVLATPQLLGLGRNFLNPNQRQDQNQKSGKSGVDGLFDQNATFLENIQSFRDRQMERLKERENLIPGLPGLQQEDSLASFARLGSQLFGAGSTIGNQEATPTGPNDVDDNKKEIFTLPYSQGQ